MSKGWLDNYGKEDNYNDSKVTLPEGFVGLGYDITGRNYSPAWGGQFQMGGNVYPVNYVPQAQMGASLPGASGMMYARTINPAPSNGKYAKKTMASAQDGKSVKYSELPYDEQDIRKFYNQMITSPSYKQRLINNGYDKQYQIGVDNVIKNRLQRVNDASLQNIQEDDGFLNQAYRMLTSGEFVKTGSGSYYNPDNKEITLVKSQMDKYKAHPRTILAHEYGHPEVEGGISNIEKDLLSQFNPKPKKELSYHDKSPSENKSDINSLRYNLYRANIFDPSTGKYKTKSGKFESSLFEKVKDDAAVQRLRNNYTDKTLIDLVNTIADNSQSEPVPIGKDGTVIKDDNGYWNPDNWGKVVEIGSNNITMQGVDQPLLGISDEGDVQYMEPGKDYKFKGKKVREYPVAKNGINNLDQKTLQDLDQLTNFTNYNTKQPGGWLDSYK